MAHLPAGKIDAWRAAASTEILQGITTYPGREWYALQCPCTIDCGCMSPEEVPRIILSRCHYPGKLDYFFTQQPFFNTYNFKVRWHCDECHGELACRMPFT